MPFLYNNTCTLKNLAIIIPVKPNLSFLIIFRLKVTFVATNGGYRQMTYENILRPDEKFTGQTSRKNVIFLYMYPNYL
jgi:hypothetical protein